MDDKQYNQIIGCAVLAIILYYVLQMIIPFLFWAVILMVAWRIYFGFNKHK